MVVLEKKKSELVSMTPRLLNELYQRTGTFEPFTISVGGYDCDISFYDGSEVFSVYGYDDHFVLCSDEIFEQSRHKELQSICKELLGVDDDDFYIVPDDDENNSFVVFESEEKTFQKSLVEDNILYHDTHGDVVLLFRNVYKFIAESWHRSSGLNVQF